LVGVIRKIEHAILPFMPDTATAINAQFQEVSIKKEKPLFPRIELKING